MRIASSRALACPLHADNCSIWPRQPAIGVTQPLRDNVREVYAGDRSPLDWQPRHAN
jgi:hypothetical protein